MKTSHAFIGFAFLSFFAGAMFGDILDEEAEKRLARPAAEMPARATCLDEAMAAPARCPHPRHRAEITTTFGYFGPSTILLCKCEQVKP